MLPTFIVIGAMRAGTTSLHSYLALHPDVFMSAKKELNFFKSDGEFSKGVEWYSAQFDGSFPVRGESSPNYTKYPVATGVALLLLLPAHSPSAAGSCVAGLLIATLCASRLERGTEAYFEGAGGFNGDCSACRCAPSWTGRGGS